MKSAIFYTDRYQRIQEATMTLLNARRGYLSTYSANSPRAVGDAIQHILEEEFRSVLGDFIASYSAGFSRRAMADILFQDDQGMRYIVDVKTHRLGTEFNMTDLTSVDRLSKLYTDENSIFCVLLVSYNIVALECVVEAVRFVPIEFFDWKCLSIGALGNGQIQLRVNEIALRWRYSHKLWMLELCDHLLAFYPREIAKITRRIQQFANVRAGWEAHEDRWQE